VGFQPHAFGKYWLVDRIATGGMAEVFKAKAYGHGGFEHLLVIKRILSHLGEDQEFVDMFIDEAKVSVALQHANIVHLYDFGRIGDEWFMAMEFLDGKDVRNLLRKLARARRLLPVEHAIYVGIEACKALDYAHRKTDLHGHPYGIVHRDVSPSNILIAYEGDVKVADFGIAKAKFSSEATDGGVLKGKYEYMSPEQASGRRTDRRSDLFALGIVMHEMLTGRRLFKTGSDVHTLERVKAADVPAPSAVNPRVPEALDRILLEALARDPDERWQSAHEMGQALQDYLFPQTIDQVRADLARLMQDLFADEIADERKRLDRGSTIAAKLRGQLAEGRDAWEGQTSSSLSRATRAARRWGPLVLAGLALALVPVLGVAVGGLLYFGRQPPAPQVQAPTTGSLDIVVLPAAQVFLDGIPHGQSTTVTVDDLAPGPHVLRLEADGYQTVLDTVTVKAGEALAYTKTLTPSAPEAPAPAPPARSHATPTPHPVTVAPAPAPAPAPKTAPAPAPKAAPAAEGTLTVSILGGGWAEVWVDGKKLAKTAPLSVALAAGEHEVRVENGDLGISHTQKVTIDPGGRATVRASPF